MKHTKIRNPKLEKIVLAAKPRSWRDLVRGLNLEALAWIGGLGWAVALFLPIYMNGWDNWWSWALQIVGIYGLVFTVSLVRRQARRYRFNSQRRISRDKRDPVLYLRSFYDDYEENSERIDRMTAEELLTSVLNEVGPVVAVGKPTDELALLGAARVYFKDEDWQANISYLISISQLVVIHANISEGLEWEIAAARERLKSQPQKLLISFLLWNAQDKATRQDLYESFRKRAAKLLECSMPEKIGDASFMYFTSGWIARFVKIDWWRTLCFRGLSPGAIRETLRPVLNQQGLKLSFLRSAMSGLISLLIVASALLLLYSEEADLGIVLVAGLILFSIRAVRTLLLTPWWAR
jgi:hypothetical protein